MNMKTTQQHIGVGWYHGNEGATVKSISKEGVSLIHPLEDNHWLLSLKDAEERIGEFKPCGKLNGSTSQENGKPQQSRRKNKRNLS